MSLREESNLKPDYIGWWWWWEEQVADADELLISGCILFFLFFNQLHLQFFSFFLSSLFLNDNDEEKRIETIEWVLTDFQLQYPVQWGYISQILFTSLICLHFPFAMFALLIEVKILIDFPSNQHDSSCLCTASQRRWHFFLSQTDTWKNLFFN